MTRRVGHLLLALAILPGACSESAPVAADAPVAPDAATTVDAGATRVVHVTVAPTDVVVAQSGSATATVDITRAGEAAPVAITVDGLDGAGITVDPLTLGAAETRGTLTLHVSASATLGDVSGTVRAGDAVTSITVTVVPAGTVLTLRADPVVVAPRGAATASVRVQRLDAGAGAITLTVAGLPAGVTVDPLTIGADAADGALVFHNDGSGVPVAAAPIIVTGTSAGGSANAASTVTLRGVGVTLTPDRLDTVSPTEDTNIPIDIATTKLDSVAGPVELRVDGLSPGVTAADIHTNAGGDATLTLTIHAHAPVSAAVGATVAATAGTNQTTATLTISIGGVTLLLDHAAVDVPAGTTAGIGIHVTRAGPSGSLSISASGLPAGVVTEQLDLADGQTAGTLHLRAAGDAPLGGPTPIRITVVAAICGRCPVAADVVPATVVAPFALGLGVDAVAVRQGATLPRAAVASVTRAAGFTGDVTLHVDGLPAGVTAPDVRIPSGATTDFLALAAEPAAPTGVAHATVTATGAGFRQTRPIDVQIAAAGPGGPAIASFTAADKSVLVGARTTLTATFDGDSATIDGIGPVTSGVAVSTPLLARTTTFTLTVTRGGERAQEQVTVAAGYLDRLRALAPSPVARTGHVATVFPGGGVIVMGGNTSESINVPDSFTSQTFDPVTERMSTGLDLPFRVLADEFTTLAPLPGGAFLLIGSGINGGPGLGADADVATSRFDPATGHFTRVGNAIVGRLGSSLATDLGDGGVLLTGGNIFPASPAVERFDPTSGTWRRVSDLVVGRRVHTGTRLDDGRVLFAGGFTCCVVTPTTVSELATAAAEIYAPDLDESAHTGSMMTARAGHTATRLLDGKVLVAGGFTEELTPLSSVEIFDPATGAFTPTTSLHTGRGQHTAVLLTDGRVLVLGGFGPGGFQDSFEDTEIFDPGTQEWTPGPLLHPAWRRSTVTMLDGGKVLVFGGEDRGGFPVNTVFLYE